MTGGENLLDQYTQPPTISESAGGPNEVHRGKGGGG